MSDVQFNKWDIGHITSHAPGRFITVPLVLEIYYVVREDTFASPRPASNDPPCDVPFVSTQPTEGRRPPHNVVDRTM